MKKNFYLFLGLFLIGILANAQVLLTEDFSSGTMPPAGWTIDAHAVNWSISNSTHAGGSSPEADLYYSPTFNGYSRLISPVVNTTGQTSLTLSFRQYMDHYATPYTIGVATRSGGGSWTIITQSNPTGSYGPLTTVLQINNTNVGASDFQFCFFFSGNSYNIND